MSNPARITELHDAREIATGVKLSDGSLFEFDRQKQTFPTWRVIAHHLALTNRWGGATEMPFSVAQHCCHVSDALIQTSKHPIAALAGLLHDAPETITGDPLSPVKQTLLYASRGQLTDFHSHSIAVLFDRLNVPLPGAAIWREVKAQDMAAWVTEWRDLTREGNADRLFPLDIAPWKHRITFWDWQKAEEQWLKRLEFICVELGIGNPLTRDANHRIDRAPGASLGGH